MKRLRLLLSVPVTFAAAAGAAVTFADPTADPAAAEFDWESITPSNELQYHDCYVNYQCARLLLPLDWLNETDERTVATAITKLPAVVGNDDPSFGGTIFAQPGGPAVSGTAYGLMMGRKLQDLFDIPGKKHYEMLSFDIRGTGHSAPRINCFPGILGVTRSIELLANGALDLSPQSLAFAVAAAKADARQCETVHGDYLSYVGTPNNARDMVAIVDKLDEQRRKTTKNSSDDSVRLELRSPGYQKGRHGKEEVPRLQYIGVSYGTVLGNYFASMFPGRVGRMVLDGVCDAGDLASGLGWLTNTADADEIVDRYFQGCFAAGQSVCALRRETDSSGTDISNRFWAWARSLDEQPIIGATNNGRRASIRLGEIRSLFLWTLYDAVYLSQALATDFDNAMRGNSTALLNRMEDFFQVSFPRDGHKACSNTSSDPLIPKDAQSAVICIDGEDATGLSNSDWREYVHEQMSISTLAGSFWASLRISCAGWTARPNWLFKGPFTTPSPSKSAESPEPGRPAAPLLFISTRWDPVTPLRNARSMAKGHPGAGVMVLESTGHSVSLNAIGPCAKDILSEYFDTGVVPSEEATCEATRSPWDSEEHH